MDKIGRLCSLLKYDLRLSVRGNLLKNAAGISLVFFLCRVSFDMTGHTGIRFWEGLFALFYGAPAYVKGQGREFVIPIIWLLFHLYALFLVCTESRNEWISQEKNVLVCCGSRSIWWMEKCIFVILYQIFYVMTAVFFLGVICILPGRQGNFGGEAAENFLSYAFVLQGTETKIYMILLPVIVLVTLSLLQLLVSLLFPSVIGYILSVIILSVSAYCQSPLLFGNYSMMARLWPFTEEGLQPGIGILLMLAADVIICLCGILIWKKQDILNQEKLTKGVALK